jgi:hypothetical protein
MRRREKIYCGNNQALPEEYDRFGLPFECLRKGYGACLYAGRLGMGIIRRTFLPSHNSVWLVLAIMILIILIVILCVILLKS